MQSIIKTHFGPKKELWYNPNNQFAKIPEMYKGTGTVYIIHFDSPLSHSQHYVGYTENLVQRIKTHRSGKGAKILAYLSANNLPWQVVRVFVGVNIHFEKYIKSRKKTRCICPFCNTKELFYIDSQQFASL